MTDTNATDAQEHQDKPLEPEDHFANILELLRKNNIDLEKGHYTDLFPENNDNDKRSSPTSPEDCVHEIVITVQYQIVATDHKNKELGCVEAIDDRYIIPVSAGEDYKPFVEKFKENFNASLVKTAEDLKLSDEV